MSVKGFLKPDWRKILLLIIIGIIVLVGNMEFGHPTIFWQMTGFLFMIDWGGCPAGGACTSQFNWFLIPCWIGLYILSCIVFWVYDKKVRKR